MRDAEQKDKAGWKGHRGAGETWEQFDALPVRVKWLYWRAPYNYTALPAYMAMRRGVDVVARIPAQIEAMRRDLQREALRLYGPEHPQAKSRSK